MNHIGALVVWCAALFPAFALGNAIGAHWTGHIASPSVLAGEWVVGFAAWHALAAWRRRGKGRANE